MGGLLTALNAGKTSLLTNQKSIEIVGNNIANVNTEGYSRQRAELTQIPAINFNDFFVGQGVTVSDVKREYDVFITRQLQEKTVGYGEENGRSTPLTELERVFSVGDTNIADEIDAFFDSWQELTTNPSGLVERDIVIQRGQLLGDAFREVHTELENVRLNINHSILSKVDALNEQIAEVARLNDRIHLVEISGQSANAARDQQELIVRDLAESLGVDTYTDGQGMLAVQLPGGLPLVQGTHAMTIIADTTGTDVNLQVEIAGVIKDVQSHNLGGEMKGLFDVRDTFLTDRRDDLDLLAFEIINHVNTAHQAGYDQNGNTGLDFFTPLATATNASRSMNVALADASEVAAAGNPAAAPGDNENALIIAQLETTATVGTTGDTFDSFFGQIVADVGIEASRNQLALNGADDALIQLQNLRDGFSGVSLEEEMIDLIQFQRGFESSAKFLSTIDEMMTSLLALKN